MPRDHFVPPSKLRLLQNRNLQVLYLAVLAGTAGYALATGAEPAGAVLFGLMGATLSVVIAAVGYVFYRGVGSLPEPE